MSFADLLTILDATERVSGPIADILTILVIVSGHRFSLSRFSHPERD